MLLNRSQVKSLSTIEDRRTQLHIHLSAFAVIVLSLCIRVAAFAQEIPADALPPSFHKERREAVREMLPKNSVAVFFANPERTRSNDVDYVYHQDPDFYYLTGYEEPNSVLLIFSDMQTDKDGNQYNELLFAQSRNPMAEMWTGRRLGPEGAKEKLEIANVEDQHAFAAYPIDFAKFDKVLFFPFQNDVRDDTQDDADLYDLISVFQEKNGITRDFNAHLQNVYAALRESSDLSLEDRKAQILRMTRSDPSLRNDHLVKAFLDSKDNEIAMSVVSQVPTTNLDDLSLDRIMNKLRETKSAEELKLLRKAINISCMGQIEVMKAMRPDMSEREIQGIHEFVYKMYGAEYEGYPSIIGAGQDGCILHYIENSKPTLGNDLVLMDAGAEYHGYSADVTRTIPANGTFSPEQRAIYDLVYKAQEAGFKECQPGNDFRAPHRAAQQVIDDGLAELGIITKGQRHMYFPHGTSHYLGLDVHDRGTYGNLKPGTVITVEPGIYIPYNSPCDKKWWGIGVRIEDDVLITETGWENLSVAAPRSADDIEKMMTQPSALDDFTLPALK